MKKLAVSLIVGASLAITPSVFALTSMSASTMKAATAQAGVSIAVDNVQIETFTASTKYTDDDGTATVTDVTGVGGTTLTGTATASSIVIGARHTLQSFNALPNGANYTGWFQAVTGVAAAGAIAKTSPLTIDVGVCPILTLGQQLNGATNPLVAGVVIGLPTLAITTSADTYSVGIESTGALNTGKNFITISTGASTMCILSGTVEIAPH